MNWVFSFSCLEPNDFETERHSHLHCCCCLVTKSYPTLCDLMDLSLSGSSDHGISRLEYWSGLPFPSPGDLSDPGIEPISPALTGGLVTTEPPAKPLSLIFPHRTWRRFSTLWALAGEVAAYRKGGGVRSEHMRYPDYAEVPVEAEVLSGCGSQTGDPNRSGTCCWLRSWRVKPSRCSGI